MLNRLRIGWRALWRRDCLERELDEELRHHLERPAEDEAMRAALYLLLAADLGCFG